MLVVDRPGPPNQEGAGGKTGEGNGGNGEAAHGRSPGHESFLWK
jgi:hypothetical protein